MKWSLLELRKYQDQPLNFSRTLDLKQAIMSRDGSVLDLAPVFVEGFILVNKEEYVVHYLIRTTLIVPSTRSLIPVEFPLEFPVDEVFMTMEQFGKREDTSAEEDILLLEGETLDLQSSIEDNILLAIPTRVLTPEEELGQELPKGEDWEVISEEEYLRRKVPEQTTDPRLAKLSEFFQETDEDSDDK